MTSLWNVLRYGSIAAACLLLATAVQAEPRRSALVIGITSYEHLPRLGKAEGDAMKVGDELKRSAKFDVTTAIDSDSAKFRQTIDEFVGKIQPDDVIVVYYAGHGVQAGGHNYLLPSDFPADGSGLDSLALRADELLKKIAARSPQLKVLILDACRNNPLKAGGPQGLAEMQAASYGAGTYIALAAAPGQAAIDGLFAERLVSEISRPGQSLGDLFIKVRDQVVSASGGRQTPLSTDQMREKFYFVPAALPDPDNALATLEQVSATMPIGEMGQTRAVEAIIANGRSLSGTDLLQGLSFKAGMLNNGDFARAVMSGADLTNAHARQAGFSKAKLAFATLNGADFSGATLEGASLSFVDAESTLFLNAKAAKSSWFGSKAPGARYNGANLQEAGFTFSDLSNSVFDGANLTGTFFVACDLRGASFRGAILDNTDFTGSLLDAAALTREQKLNACQTIDTWPPNLSVTLIEVIPSNRFSGGYEYSRFLDKRYPFYANVNALPPCRKRNLSSDGWAPIWGANGREMIRTDFSTGFSHKLLQQSGRRTMVRSRVEQQFEALKTARAVQK
jgi:uncharacterized protein YjbI with pentapeptide repeats